jgi:TPR repeat protein
MRAFLLCLCLVFGASHAKEIVHQDAKPLAQAQRAVDQGRWKEARQRLLPLAKKGNPIAQWSLARLLELPTPARDLKAALHWYTVLAETGAPAAMEAVGLAHYLGRGTQEDLLLAADWFRRAGSAGEVGSQYILATMYERGQGVPQDDRLALAWFERAAAQGDEAAKAKLQAWTPTTPL